MRHAGHDDNPYFESAIVSVPLMASVAEQIHALGQPGRQRQQRLPPND
jgi:hypothetical protein